MNLHSLRQGLGVSAVALSRYMAALATESARKSLCNYLILSPQGTLRNPLGHLSLLFWTLHLSPDARCELCPALRRFQHPGVAGSAQTPQGCSSRSGMSSGWDLDLTLLDPHFLLDRDLRGHSYGQSCSDSASFGLEGSALVPHCSSLGSALREPTGAASHLSCSLSTR